MRENFATSPATMLAASGRVVVASLGRGWDLIMGWAREAALEAIDCGRRRGAMLAQAVRHQVWIGRPGSATIRSRSPWTHSNRQGAWRSAVVQEAAGLAILLEQAL